VAWQRGRSRGRACTAGPCATRRTFRPRAARTDDGDRRPPSTNGFWQVACEAVSTSSAPIAFTWPRGGRTHHRDRAPGSGASRPTGTPRGVVGSSTPPSDVRSPRSAGCGADRARGGPKRIRDGRSPSGRRRNRPPRSGRRDSEERAPGPEGDCRRRPVATPGFLRAIVPIEAVARSPMEGDAIGRRGG
jgi:hypothetical protein